MSLLFDLLLATGLLGLGWQVAAGRSMFRSIVMFVALGLLVAVVWARLGAPDLALAEAAVSAGVTGAMLMLSYRRLIQILPDGEARPPARRSPLALPIGLLCTTLVMGLGWLMFSLPAPTATAGEAAATALVDHEVGNPVTAVLLVFRGYDTLLEVGVLLVAWMGVKIVQPMARVQAPRGYAPAPVVNALLAALIPTTVLVSGYLLHAGGKAPGGAFQAGAVLAGAGVLLALNGRLVSLPEPGLGQRLLVVVGLVVFASLSLAPLTWGGPVMTLSGTGVIYAVEAALTVSITMLLMLLFLRAGGVGRAST